MRSTLTAIIPNTFVVFLFLAGCGGQAPVTEQEQVRHQPLQTEGGWIWTMQEVQTKLNDGQITQENANKTLAADGEVCATQASDTPVQTANCESEFVFECVDLPEVGFSKCSSSVRGPSCKADEMKAIHRVQEAAFVNCMLEIGWKKHKAMPKS